MMSGVDKGRQTTDGSSVARDEQFGIVIPTYNASRYWSRLQASFREQGISPDQVLVVDSSSTDDTRDLVQRSGYRLKKIKAENFRHGATRQMAVELLPWAEVVLFLTQDSLPFGDRPIERLLSALRDPEVGAVYGRQLPRPEADPIETHARLFNYPDHSEVRSYRDRHELGMKTILFSNSFAAFRRAALEEAGGFPKNTIVSEEVTVIARMLQLGWKIAYQADATAIHSHPLTLKQEFSRYFDIGVHRGRECWIHEDFGNASGQGQAFVRSELRFLRKQQPSLIPLAMLRNVSKWCSYQLGLHERYLPESLKEVISGQPNFWRDGRAASVAAAPAAVPSPVNTSSARAPEAVGSRHRRSA